MSKKWFDNVEIETVINPKIVEAIKNNNISTFDELQKGPLKRYKRANHYLCLAMKYNNPKAFIHLFKIINIADVDLNRFDRCYFSMTITLLKQTFKCYYKYNDEYIPIYFEPYWYGRNIKIIVQENKDDNTNMEMFIIDNKNILESSNYSGEIWHQILEYDDYYPLNFDFKQYMYNNWDKICYNSKRHYIPTMLNI